MVVPTGRSQIASESFDFEQHARNAVAEYLGKRPFYGDFAGVVGRVIEECLKKRGVKVHSVQHRAKEADSFGKKAAIPSETDPNTPRYRDPLSEITDLAGVRIITHFLETIHEVDRLLREEFEVTERSDKSEELLAEDRFGYQSIHYLVRLSPERAKLGEYERFAGAVAEVQVRTILQHTWAEIEHDIQYKSATTIPTEIHRRFMALAGLLEIADREFQAIQDTDRALEKRAENLVARGDLQGLEITPNALKLFLNKRLSADGRISDWTYDWTVRLLMHLGFRDLKQVEAAIEPFDDNRLSDLIFGGRQGQTTRFELMLLAAMGERFLERHFYKESDWFVAMQRGYLEKFAKEGIKVGQYDPMTKGWPERMKRAQEITSYHRKGVAIDRIRYGAEDVDRGSDSYPCRDCGVAKDQFHVPGCDGEQCPVCGDQMISCGCVFDEDDDDTVVDVKEETVPLQN